MPYTSTFYMYVCMYIYVIKIHVSLYVKKKFNFFRLKEDKFPNFRRDIAY